jgi:excisionase family DNA binding protein
MNAKALTAGQAAAHLGVSIATIRRWCDAGELPHWKTPGGQRRFDAEQLSEWLRSRSICTRPVFG